MLLSPSAEAADAAPLRVATFECDATPPLGSWLYTEPLATVEHPLLAKGIVLDDGAQRVRARGDRLVRAGRFDASAAAKATRRSRRHGRRPRHGPMCPPTHRPRLRRRRLGSRPAKEGPARGLQSELRHRNRQPAGQGDSRTVLANLQPVDRIGTGQAKVERVASSRRIPLPDGKVQTRFRPPPKRNSKPRRRASSTRT